ncbi:class I SAM-dependent methyltransferase [bacterium]|nr:class I SAM-dependent methyltransferase [bacterium]
MGVYEHPLYYELAFGFVDIKKQIDLFQEIFKRHFRLPAKRVLDIGCGPSLQLRELARRGYECTGLDNSPSMLAYLRDKALEEGLRIETFTANMADFRLEKKADFACCMMGTVNLLGSNRDFLSHLDSVAYSLYAGGLYFIENLRLNWPLKDFFGTKSWEQQRDGIKVKTSYTLELEDALWQTVKETLKLEVDDAGVHQAFEETRKTKLIFPQELYMLVAKNGKFEFLGWYEQDRFAELKQASNDNFVLLKKR